MKPWYTSKTIWIGIVTLVAACIPLVAEFIKSTTPDASATVTAIAGMILGIIQIVRRIYLDGETTPPAIGTPKSDSNISGQGMVEYALILVLVAVVVIAALTVLGPLASNVFTTINNAIATPVPVP